MHHSQAFDFLTTFGAVAVFEQIGGTPKVTIKMSTSVRGEVREFSSVASSLEQAVEELVRAIESAKRPRFKNSEEFRNLHRWITLK